MGNEFIPDNTRVLLKNIFWDSILAKVASMLGLIGTAQTAITLFKPEWVITIANKFSLDSRFWFIIAITFWIWAFIMAFRKANAYRKLLMSKNQIRIMYDEKNILCKEIKAKSESYRIAISVIGRESLKNIMVFPSAMFHIVEPTKWERIQIATTGLTPMIPTPEVHPGKTPSYYVNIFRHEMESPNITLWYSGYPALPIQLGEGSYRLELIARAEGSGSEVATLLLTMDKDNNLHVKSPEQ